MAAREVALSEAVSQQPAAPSPPVPARERALGVHPEFEVAREFDRQNLAAFGTVRAPTGPRPCTCRRKVIIDADLARVYGVSTKRLNEQVKRNRGRSPGDFMFQLTQTEKTGLVANCDQLSRLRFAETSPYAFSEHGAIKAAGVLNSQQPVAKKRQIGFRVDENTRGPGPSA